MKIINEKGKLFGIINIVDLLVLLLLVCIIGGIAWKLTGDKISEAVAPNTTMVVRVAIAGAVPALAEEAERQQLVGQHLIADGAYLGATITDFWLEDYAISAETANGDIVNSVDPVKQTIWVEITTEVAKNTLKPTIGAQEIRVGRGFTLKTLGFECESIIYYMEIAE